MTDQPKPNELDPLAAGFYLMLKSFERYIKTPEELNKDDLLSAIGKSIAELEKMGMPPV